MTGTGPARVGDERTRARSARRRAERIERKALRQRSSEAPGGISLMTLSLGAVAIGLIGVIAFAVLSAPAPATDLTAPQFPSPQQFADGMTLGAADAPVTVDLWEDFQCPACREFTEQFEPVVVNDYVINGKVRLVYHDLSFIGPESVAAAIAARVAGESGKYWPYHDYLFTNQLPENSGGLNQARLEAIATAVGLNLDTFRAGQSDAAIRQAVTTTSQEGRAAGITQTPTIVVGDQRIVGVPANFSDLKTLIDEALANAGGS
jgi:protein-disulfide isomerase